MVAAASAAAVPAASAQSWREAQLQAAGAAGEPASWAAGIGFSWRDRGRSRIGAAIGSGADENGAAMARSEVAWHFLLDPGRRSGSALYGGAGVAVQSPERGRSRAWFMLILGLEWNPAGSRGLFIEGGAAGGVRVAAGLRFRHRNS